VAAQIGAPPPAGPDVGEWDPLHVDLTRLRTRHDLPVHVKNHSSRPKNAAIRRCHAGMNRAGRAGEWFSSWFGER
jgi:hypothetical protein